MKAPSMIYTHEVLVGDLDTLLATLARCDGKHADCTILVWEQAQFLVQTIRSLQQQVAEKDPRRDP